MAKRNARKAKPTARTQSVDLWPGIKGSQFEGLFRELDEQYAIFKNSKDVKVRRIAERRMRELMATGRAKMAAERRAARQA